MERYLAAFECVSESGGRKHQLMCLPLRLENNDFALVVNCLGSHLPPQLMHYDGHSRSYYFRSADIPDIFLDAAGAINAAISEQFQIQIKTGQVRED